MWLKIEKLTGLRRSFSFSTRTSRSSLRPDPSFFQTDSSSCSSSVFPFRIITRRQEAGDRKQEESFIMFKAICMGDLERNKFQRKKVRHREKWEE